MVEAAYTAGTVGVGLGAVVNVAENVFDVMEGMASYPAFVVMRTDNLLEELGVGVAEKMGLFVIGVETGHEELVGDLLAGVGVVWHD